MRMRTIDRVVKRNALLCHCARKLIHFYFCRAFGVPAGEFNQIEATTSYDRYPELFSAARDLISPRDAEPIRILSYGCSTGEECQSLRHYFPRAHITGVDINKRSLREARGKNTDANIAFLLSTPENVMTRGPYDVVFALSVLCRWPETQFTTDASRVFPFRRFNEIVTLLDSAVAPEGLLVILNANFLFSDSDVSGNYQTFAPLGVSQYECVHKFSRDNVKIDHVGDVPCIFLKTSGRAAS